MSGTFSSFSSSSSSSSSSSVDSSRIKTSSSTERKKQDANLELKIETSPILRTLVDLKLDPKNYEIVGGMAIYRGRIKDYKKVKENFEAKISEVFSSNSSESSEIAGHVADFVNLGGTSSTQINIIEIKDKAYKLDDLTRVLGITKRVGGNFQGVSREEATIAAIGAAYADHTRETIQSVPTLSKIRELGDLGFTNSFYCSNLSQTDYKTIYLGLLDFELRWDTSKRPGPKPTRFTEKMFFYCTLVLKHSPSFYNGLKTNFQIAKGLAPPPQQFFNQQVPGFFQG